MVNNRSADSEASSSREATPEKEDISMEVRSFSSSFGAILTYERFVIDAGCYECKHFRDTVLLRGNSRKLKSNRFAG
jgi:hypothetical protein